ncbi:MAG: hypothetical protein J6Y78_08960 [Paludibacteraceae bacterium]|nr:hypothetical protein [Paludibacteraceae bacterium]
MIVYLSAFFEGGSNFKLPKGKEVWDYYDLSELSILQSFAYAKPKYAEHYKDCKNFMLDSGGFTLIHSKSAKTFDIKKFTKEYGEFVKKYGVENFVELDVDNVYDMETYIYCLHLLQDITGKDPLRVFHLWRGKEYWEELTKQKDYVCLAALEENKLQKPQSFRWFLDTAHKNGCKVHGLGETRTDQLLQYDFDTVDSSTWTHGSRAGCMYHFNGSGIKVFESNDNGKRCDNEWLNKWNFKEWSDYSKMMLEI